MSFVKVSATTILLFSIYNKGDKDSISDKEIEELIKSYLYKNGGRFHSMVGYGLGNGRLS